MLHKWFARKVARACKHVFMKRHRAVVFATTLASELELDEDDQKSFVEVFAEEFGPE
jgi:hypothetical protein